MTSEQSSILDYLEEQRVAAIQGGAGTGKTMLAIEKAIRLSGNGKVLFLCFNRFLLNYLRENYSMQHPDIEFYNLPSLSVSKTGNINAIDNDSITAFLNEYDPDNWPYRHLVVDEGQDFLPEHISLLKTIAEMQKGCFYIFYDKNQLVQQRQNMDWIDNLDCRLVLSANCRNTRSIAITSYRPIGIDSVKMRTEVIGNKPQLYIENDASGGCDRIAKIIRQYTDNGIQRKDIVILTAKTEDTSILTGIDSIGSYGIKSEPKENGILFTSARKFKGLEAQVVIMVDVDETTFETEESKRVFYVGTSRAKHFLEFVSVIDEKQLSLMADRLVGQKAKNAKLTLGSQLKVKLIVE